MHVTAAIHDEASHTPGFIVSTQLFNMIDFVNRDLGDWSPVMNAGSMVFIMDGDGDLVWWYRSRLGLTPRARMSYDEKSMWLILDRTEVAGGEIELVSMDTLNSRIIEEVIGASHDATVVNNDVLAYISTTERARMIAAAYSSWTWTVTR